MYSLMEDRMLSVFWYLRRRVNKQFRWVDNLQQHEVVEPDTSAEIKYSLDS